MDATLPSLECPLNGYHTLIVNKKRFFIGTKTVAQSVVGKSHDKENNSSKEYRKGYGKKYNASLDVVTFSITRFACPRKDSVRHVICHCRSIGDTAL